MECPPLLGQNAQRRAHRRHERFPDRQGQLAGIFIGRTKSSFKEYHALSQKLARKVAVVRGASKGIGAEIARHFVAEGAAVGGWNQALLARPVDAADPATRSATGFPGRQITR